jgi:hypothetical protein
MLVVSFRHLFDATLVAHPSAGLPAVDADRWSTSSFADAADTSPLELFDLGEHLQRCRRSRGRLFTALCVSDAVDRFLARRFITTMTAIALLSTLLAML